MLNSTLHLNVFGRVNTALIDKDSQCIYQLSRLSTLTHWSLPWSRGGGMEEKGGGSWKRLGEGTAVIKKTLLTFKLSILLHFYLMFKLNCLFVVRCTHLVLENNGP